MRKGVKKRELLYTGTINEDSHYRKQWTLLKKLNVELSSDAPDIFETYTLERCLHPCLL